MWNSVAQAWERQAAFVDAHLADATEVLLDMVAVGPGVTVIELACGPGGAGLAAADRVGPSGRVVLADVAEEMVGVAGRRAGGRSNVSTTVCDQLHIAAPDASFDAVIVRHGLMFADDPSSAVRAAVRVLRPDGRYGSITWASRADNPWLGLILDAVGEQFGVPFPPPSVPGPFALGDPRQVATILEGGGLEDVEVREMLTPMSAASLDAWWERVPQLAGPLAIALEGMEPQVRDAIRARAIDSGRGCAHMSDEGIVMDGSVLIAAGRRPS